MALLKDTGGNTLQQAKGFRLGSRRIDQVSGLDLNDFYFFRLNGRSHFKLHLGGLAENADVELIQDRDRNGSIDLGEVVASSRATGRKADSINIVGLGRGTYYVRVFAKTDGTTDYRLSLSATPTNTISPTYDVVLRTNTYRNQNGLPSLALNTQLTVAAQKYARVMAVDDNFSHTSPDGTQWWERIVAAGYDYSEAAENLAAGHTSASSALRGWINSPGHRDNLLAYQVQEIGTGYFFLPRDTGTYTYKYYWSQSFGTPGDVRVTPNVPEGRSNR